MLFFYPNRRRHKNTACISNCSDIQDVCECLPQQTVVILHGILSSMAQSSMSGSLLVLISMLFVAFCSGVLSECAYAQAASGRSGSSQQRVAQQIAQLEAQVNQALQQNNKERALDLLDQILEIAPKDGIVWANRGQVRVRMRDYEGAVADFTESIRLKPPQYVLAVVYTTRGSTYMNLQKFKEALADFAAGIKLNPKNHLAYLNMGITYTLLGETDKAIASLDKAISLDPGSPSAYYERGNARLARDPFAAIQDYTEAIRRNPQYVEAYFNRGAARGRLKNHADAIEDFTKLIELMPSNPRVYINRALAYIELAEYAKAVEDCSAVLRFEPGNSQAVMMRGNAKYRMKDHRGAFEDFTLVLKNNPQDVTAFLNSTSYVHAMENQEKFDNNMAYFNRGQARLMMGDTLGARYDWQKAADLGNTQAALMLNGVKSLVRTFEPLELSPVSLQLLPRGNNDSATVELGGTLYLPNFDSCYVEVYKNDALWKRFAEPLRYKRAASDSAQLGVLNARFAFTISLHAELSHYDLRIGVKTARRSTQGQPENLLLYRADSVVCGDVVLISGQSNAVLGQTWQAEHREFMRTFKYGYADNSWVKVNAANEDGMGGIGALGLRLAENLIHERRVPVCILNGALAASTIEQHLPDTANHLNPNTLYGRFLLRLKRSQLLHAVTTMVWYQGESNTAERYAEKFRLLFAAWKQDIPRLSTLYVFQIRPSHCTQSDHAMLCEVQRRLPEQFPDVRVIASTDIEGHDGCHYNDNGYKQLGERLWRAINAESTIGVTKRHGQMQTQQSVAQDNHSASVHSTAFRSATLHKAVLQPSTTATGETEITLVFLPENCEIVAASSSMRAVQLARLSQAPQTRYSLEQCFTLVNTTTQQPVPDAVASVHTQGNSVRLKLKRPLSPSASYAISYTTPWAYPGTTIPYQGPWLETKQSMGVLLFHAVPIEQQSSTK